MTDQLDDELDPAEARAETAAEDLDALQAQADYAEGESEKEVKVDAPILPAIQVERGGVAFCELYGILEGHVIKINVTERGENSEAALFGLLSTIHKAKEWKLRPYMPESSPAAPKSQAAPAGSPPPPTGGAPKAPAAPAQPPAGNVPQGGEILTQKVDVEPRTDGKMNVKFYSQGHQYADLTMVGTPAQIVARFPEGWTEAHFAGVASYAVGLRVKWLPSTNLNSKGNPYKNIVSVEMA